MSTRKTPCVRCGKLIAPHQHGLGSRHQQMHARGLRSALRSLTDRLDKLPNKELLPLWREIRAVAQKLNTRPTPYSAHYISPS